MQGNACVSFIYNLRAQDSGRSFHTYDGLAIIVDRQLQTYFVARLEQHFAVCSSVRGIDRPDGMDDTFSVHN